MKPMDKLFDWLCYKLEDKGLGYGCALVDIYLYGYLKIVLPTPEDTNGSKGIEERIRDFRKKQGLTKEQFPVERLFLLVTSSGFVPPNIAKFHLSKNRIEPRKNLTLEPVLKRNGVENRCYKTTVYQIFNCNKTRHVSVVLEAAPCLRTLCDSCEYNSALNKFRSNIIKKFSERLKITLNEQMDCRDKCVIIYCNEDDRNFSLADEILNKVRELETLSHEGLTTTVATGNSCSETESIPVVNPISWYFLEKIYDYMDIRGFGYASAMADNYFYGYLKIVLPDEGTLDLIGIQERINIFISEEEGETGLNLEAAFPSRKLFLLVTSSGFTPRDISEYRQGSNRIKLYKNLSGEPVLDRNGVKRRTYKTTVYQVFKKDMKDSLYLVMEGAPCLRQLYEAAERNLALKKLRLKIIKQFMSHLNKKLKNEDCRNCCEIIFFDDSNRSFNLADFILEKISREN